MIGHVNQPSIGDLTALSTTPKTSVAGALGTTALGTEATTISGAIAEINSLALSMADAVTAMYGVMFPNAEWWQLPFKTCLGAYTSQNFATYAETLANLTGGADLIDMGTPVWNSMYGWYFDGTNTMWLDTGLAATEGNTIIVRTRTMTANKFMCGAWNSGASKGFGLGKNSASKRRFYSGGYVDLGNVADFDVMGIAGAQPYTNGYADGAPLAAWGATISPTLAIGALNGLATSMCKGCVLQFAAYSGTLTAAEMLSVSTRMGAIRAGLITFGDSVTAGSGASDAAHRYANLLAADWGMYLENKGIAGTVLQNTDGLTNNGRDRYAADVAFWKPERVVILYGLNDLRYNDADFTVANYQNDLGEVVAGLIASGLAANKIMIGSPPYMDPASYSSAAPYDAGTTLKHTQYVAAAAAVATAYSTQYCDVYAYMLANGDTALMADGIHPNDAGHQAIADVIAAAWV